MTVGLKTVREVCMRCPLVMDEALLSDLVLYRKERDKYVKNAAKALTGLFRELKPSMLGKRDRGRGADLSLQLAEYGAHEMQHRCAFCFRGSWSEGGLFMMLPLLRHVCSRCGPWQAREQHELAICSCGYVHRDARFGIAGC
jgi:SDA1